MPGELGRLPVVAARILATVVTRAYCQKSAVCHKATSSSRSGSVPAQRWRNEDRVLELVVWRGRRVAVQQGPGRCRRPRPPAAPGASRLQDRDPGGKEAGRETGPMWCLLPGSSARSRPPQARLRLTDPGHLRPTAEKVMAKVPALAAPLSAGWLAFRASMGYAACRESRVRCPPRRCSRCGRCCFPPGAVGTAGGLGAGDGGVGAGGQRQDRPAAVVDQ